MFVLRRITSQNVESNTVLGEYYVLIDAERNQDDFSKSIDFMKCDKNDVYGFISHNSGNKLIPLYKKSAYFVMTESGKTFANVSFK
ncbi:hypothetical protein KAR91_25795 [Candidatus Pacearchaeota archaeon]|nr:hypothetical protein [Candidatus Pacearchaeota archaeon]